MHGRCRSTFRCRRPLRRGGRRPAAAACDETSVDLSEFQTRFAPVVVGRTEGPASTEAWRGRANDTRIDNASSRAVADRAHPPAGSELARGTGINAITSVNKQVLPSSVRKRSAAKTSNGFDSCHFVRGVCDSGKHCQKHYCSVDIADIATFVYVLRRHKRSNKEQWTATFNSHEIKQMPPSVTLVARSHSWIELRRSQGFQSKTPQLRAVACRPMSVLCWWN